MKRITFLLLLTYFFLPCKSLSQPNTCKENIYWEEVSDIKKKDVLKSRAIDKYALSYYLGNFKPSDDSITVAMIENTLDNSVSCYEKAFYFYVFNQVCMKADGALSETLGAYCQRFMLNSPTYVINYFRTHKNIETVYASLIGSELYFKEEGTSTIEYNYTDFKRIIRKKIGGNKIHKETLNEFFSLINASIKKMD